MVVIMRMMENRKNRNKMAQGIWGCLIWSKSTSGGVTYAKLSYSHRGAVRTGCYCVSLTQHVDIPVVASFYPQDGCQLDLTIDISRVNLNHLQHITLALEYKTLSLSSHQVRETQ